MEVLGLLDLKEMWDQWVLLVLQGRRDLKDLRAVLEFREELVHRVLLGPVDRLVHLDLLVLLALEVTLVQLGHLGRGEMLDHQDHLALLDLKVPKVLLVLLD